jgi:histidine ammonia-lyase
MPVSLDDAELTLDQLAAVARGLDKVTLGPQARARMARSRAYIDTILKQGADAPMVYGVNTGFGALAEVRISPAQIRDLQRNLVRSHAAGVGPDLPVEAVRAMVLLRAKVISLGLSGVRPEVGDLLCEMLNRRVHPVIPSRGSVGASGDLAPLAHLALCAIGEGEADYDGVRMASADALRRAGLEPLELEAKEGLCLVNGTQAMTAVGSLAVLDAQETCRLADVAGALSLEALKGSRRAFDPRIHAARPHPGQRHSAQNLYRLLDGSAIVESHKHCGKVQDPYSLRCMPQVHGATRDALAYAADVLYREMQSATDNPLVLDSDEQGEPPEILSGGNFHGQPVAIALDLAGLATAELANISERRVEQLVNPHYSGLPAFLAEESGLNSGFMLAQVTAAAMVSENKILAHPASVDSIPSSAGREDHVSMGMHSALKLRQIVDNVRVVLTVELLCAAQGLDLRLPLRPAGALAAAHDAIRKVVPHMGDDRPMYKDVAALRRAVDDGTILTAVEKHAHLS